MAGELKCCGSVVKTNADASRMIDCAPVNDITVKQLAQAGASDETVSGTAPGKKVGKCWDNVW